MKALNEAFGVVCCIAPGEGPKHRHYPICADLKEAAVHFSQAVENASTDLSIMRVALHRYTVGKTELLDEWHTPGFTCTLHRESDPSKLIITERAA